MTDLELLRGERDESTVARFSRRVEPTYGFIIYGVGYFFVSSFAGVAGGLVGGLLAHAVGFTKDSNVTGAFVLVLSLVAWIAAWIPFARWAKRKRSNARSLVREGEIHEAKVATSTTDRLAQLAAKLAMSAAGGPTSVTWERVVFEHRGGAYAGVAPFNSRPAQGTSCHVLFHPLAKYMLAFSPEGQAFVAKAHQV